ncbi:MAG: glycoside hydrolase family 25 protein [Pseudomonadota bacterium]
MAGKFQRVLLGALALVSAFLTAGAANEFNQPWRYANSAIVLDAYEYTPLDWTKLPNNKRLAGFINKASDGLPPTYRCKGDRVCRLKWRRYSATQELYKTRKVLAKTQGLKWGAYHLARPGNPIKQAEHFLRFTRPEKDDLLALDIEHNDPTKWMSLADAEVFAKHIKMRVGRYPLLYTNHHTSKYIAANRDKYPLLSRLNLWYARYKPSVPGVFPMGNWDSYTIWQFSSMVNCNKKSCLRRIKGADDWIDVNVVAMSPQEMRKQWPFAELRAVEVPTSSQPVAAAKGAVTGADPATTAAIAPVKAKESMPRFSLPTDIMEKPVTVAVVAPRFRPDAKLVETSGAEKLKSAKAKLAKAVEIKRAAFAYAPLARKKDGIKNQLAAASAPKTVKTVALQTPALSKPSKGPDDIIDALIQQRVLARFTLPVRFTTPGAGAVRLSMAGRRGLPGDV